MFKCSVKDIFKPDCGNDKCNTGYKKIQREKQIHCTLTFFLTTLFLIIGGVLLVEFVFTTDPAKGIIGVFLLVIVNELMVQCFKIDIISKMKNLVGKGDK